MQNGLRETKAWIVNLLVDRFGLKNYIEICTPSTGKHFAQIDRAPLASCSRIMYIAHEFFDDGMLIDMRSPDESLATQMYMLRAAKTEVDVVLVDGWHTYHTASRDIMDMFDLLPEGGIMVVHDCNPQSREVASPGYRAGEWCGVQYKAYLDFVLGREDLDYFTVDCDYGCGVIVKGTDFAALLDRPDEWHPPKPAVDLCAAFRAPGSEYDEVYDVFAANREPLLRLISTDQLQDAFAKA